MAEATGAAAAGTLAWKSLLERPIDVLVWNAGRPLPTDAQMLDTMRALGCEARFVVEADLRLEPARVLWMRGSPGWHRGTYRRLTGMEPAERPLVIQWHHEPLPMPRSAGYPPPSIRPGELARMLRGNPLATDPYTNSRWIRRTARAGLVDVLCATSLGGKAYLAERGVEAAYVPIGYHRQHGRDLGLERDLDVLFVGDPSVRRRSRILRRLRRDGLNVLAAGSWRRNKGLWGEERTRVLNRTKILLNLARHPGLLPDARLILGMANKALVVSEPIYQPEPYEPGRHYVSARISELAAVVERYLADDRERRGIAEVAHDFVTRQLTMERSVNEILGLAAERLEAR